MVSRRGGKGRLGGEGGEGLVQGKPFFRVHSPGHPYTRALLSAIPRPDPRIKRDRIILKGDVPSPMNPPPGCRFHARCPERFEPCDQIIPEMQEVAAGHFVACHLY